MAENLKWYNARNYRKCLKTLEMTEIREKKHASNYGGTCGPGPVWSDPLELVIGL